MDVSSVSPVRGIEEQFPQSSTMTIRESCETSRAASVANIFFNKIAVFGDSLSDPGNAYSLWHRETAPPYDTLDELLVPDYPYKDHHHYCNGPTWIELFAEAHKLALSGGPAFAESDGSRANFAVGRARARNTKNTDRIDLSGQVDEFLHRTPGVVPGDTLCVLEIGANDVRDALVSQKDASSIISEALSEIDQNIEKLYARGARKFLVWDIPDIGKTPTLRSLDLLHPGIADASKELTIAFNTGLKAHIIALSRLQGIEIAELDVYKTLDQMVANPREYGLRVVDSPCVMPNYSPCYHQNFDEYLFWDGIHPAEGFHKAVAQEAALLALRDERCLP